MTLPSLIHHHINIRHSGRLSAGSGPAYVEPRHEPTNAPQIFRRSVRSAYSFRHARLSLKTKQSDRRPCFNVPDAHAAVKSP